MPVAQRSDDDGATLWHALQAARGWRGPICRSRASRAGPGPDRRLPDLAGEKPEW